MSETTPEAAALLVLAKDLLISSRITTAARRAGVPVRLVRDPAALAASGPGVLLIVDLDLEGAIPAAVDWAHGSKRPAAGFVQHVHADRIREALQAGIHPIIPRSRLEAALPELLGALTR